MTDPLAGLRALVPRSDPLAGLRALTGGRGWESTDSPLVQRRRRPDGSWEYRPTPRADAGPQLNAEPTEPPSAYDRAIGSTLAGMDPKLAGRNVLSGMKSGAEFLAEAPRMVGEFLTGPAFVPPQAGAVQITYPEMVEGTLESVREERERLMEESAAQAEQPGVSPTLAAASFALPQAAGSILDPTGFLPIGKVGKAAKPAGGVVADDLAELAAKSLRIAPSPAAAERAVVADFLDVSPPESATRTIQALSPTGDEIGELRYTRAPGGGFTVDLVTTGQRGSGAGRALMRHVAEKEGPFKGALAQTAEGEAFFQRLRETDPDVFGGAQKRPLVPEVLPPDHAALDDFSRFPPEHFAPPGFGVRRSAEGVHVLPPGGKERTFRGATAERDAATWLDRKNEEGLARWEADQRIAAQQEADLPAVAEPHPEYRTYSPEIAWEMEQDRIARHAARMAGDPNWKSARAEPPAPPPPRVPLDALPEPAEVPLRDFSAISPLPPEATQAVHRFGVQQAVDAGEKVRPAVLGDYPELAADVAVPPARGLPVNPEAGFVKIPTGPGFLSRWFKKDGQFSALGELRGWAFTRSNDMAAEIAAGQRRVTDTLRDFSSAFEDDVLRAGHSSPDDVLRYIDEGLQGQNDLSGISPRLRTAVLGMREHIDQLSEGYERYADLPQALRETIEANKGSYLPRVFEAFENPDWKSIVDPTSPKHDPREAWRWNQYMDWARGERDAAATAPLYRGALVKHPSHDLPGQVLSYDPATQTAQVNVPIGDGSTIEVSVSRAEVTNLADHIKGNWTDDQLTAYGQRLLDRDPDAFFGVGETAVGREGRGNLKRRILQDPRVNDLPTDLAAKVNDGKLSLPTAIEQAKQRPGWWAEYLQNAPGLPQEIDDLMGLYRDPSQRYKTGAVRAVHDQAVYKMHDDLRQQGLGSIFFTEDTMVPGHYEKIGGGGPLADLVTSPEIAAVIRGTENTSRSASAWLNVWRKINGGTKLAKTALNFPAGHMRNLAAWPFQLLSGGHFTAAFDPRGVVKALPYQVTDKLGTQRGAVARLGKRLADTVELANGQRLGEAWSMHLDSLRPEIRFLYEQGVFGESTHAADLKHYAGAFPALREPEAISTARKVLKAPVDTGINFWAGGDDLGKHVYFRAELHNLAWAENLGAVPDDFFARPEWQDVAREAAQRTRLATPTHSMIAPGIKALRDAPLAPFPGWTSEVFRNAKENVRLGLQDLKHANPRRKVLGAKRLAGFASASALAGGALGAAINKLSGVEDPEGVRQFVPPWSRDSQLAVIGLDRGAGQVRYVDLSALLPQAAFADSMGTILRSVQDPTDSSWDAALDSAQSLAQPYIEEEIIANAVLDWARNKQGGESALARPLNMLRQQERYDPGYPVYTEGANAWTQAKQSAYHWWRNLGPSGVLGLGGERLARAFWKDNPEVRKAFVELTNYDRELEVKDELMAQGLGLRVTTTDISKSLSRLGTDYVRRRSDASSLYTRRSRMGVEGQAHPEVLLAAKEEANEMARAAHDQAARVVMGALRLGFSQDQVRQWLKKGNIATKHTSRLIEDALLLREGKEPMNFLPVVF